MVATHGRSFWILDDLTPLHQLADGRSPPTAHLFAPRPTVRWRAYKGHGMKPGPGREVAYRMAGSVGYAYRQVDTPTGEKQRGAARRRREPAERRDRPLLADGGARRRPDARLPRRRRPRDPHLHEPPRGGARRPGAGRAAGRDGRRGARGAGGAAAAGGDDEPRPTKHAGANRFVWNLRGKDATKLPDNKGRGGTAEMLAAPRVPPGAYQVRLTVNGRDADAAVRDREGSARRRPATTTCASSTRGPRRPTTCSRACTTRSSPCATSAPRRRRGPAACSPARQGRGPGPGPHADRRSRAS